MTSNIILNFLLTMLCVLALLHVREWFREQVVANYRAELFELRRQLFVLAADDRLSPNSVVYVRLRNILNGLLLQAERITFGQMIVTVARTRNLDFGNDPTVGLIDAVKDESTRTALLRLHTEIGSASMRQMRRTSWFSAFLPLLLVLSALKRGTTILKRIGQAIETQGAVASEFETAPT